MSEDLEPKKSETQKQPDVAALAETELDGVVGGTAAQVATTPTNAEGAGAGKVADPWAILK
jgi:hypothetical protein